MDGKIVDRKPVTDNYMVFYTFGLVKFGWANPTLPTLPTQFQCNSILTLIIDET